jgi:Fe2+ or Zn2+ uptake regulation protein
MSRSEIRTKFEAHGILPTPQRLEVAEILLQKPQHMSAD